MKLCKLSLIAFLFVSNSFAGELMCRSTGNFEWEEGSQNRGSDFRPEILLTVSGAGITMTVPKAMISDNPVSLISLQTRIPYPLKSQKRDYILRGQGDAAGNLFKSSFADLNYFHINLMRLSNEVTSGKAGNISVIYYSNGHFINIDYKCKSM